MNSLINLIYDFTRRPYDTDWWGTTLGVPTIVSGNLVLGGSATIMGADFMKGNLEMEITIPTAPASGHTRQFGWKAGGQGAYAYFEISGTTFQAATSDGEGNSQTAAITWNSDWDNAATLFKIRWDASGFTFLVDGIRKAKISEDTKMPRVPMSPYMASLGGGTGDMLVSYISIIGAQTMFHVESVNSDYFPLDPGNTVSVSDTQTITEAITLAHVASDAASVSDTQTITEALTINDVPADVSVSDTQTMTEDITINDALVDDSVSDTQVITEAITIDAAPAGNTITDNQAITEFVNVTGAL